MLPGGGRIETVDERRGTVYDGESTATVEPPPRTELVYRPPSVITTLPTETLPGGSGDPAPAGVAVGDPAPTPAAVNGSPSANLVVTRIPAAGAAPLNMPR